MELGSTLPGHVDNVPILYCKNHIQIGPKKGIFRTIMGMGFFDHQSHGRVLILRRKAFEKQATSTQNRRFSATHLETRRFQLRHWGWTVKSGMMLLLGSGYCTSRYTDKGL